MSIRKAKLSKLAALKKKRVRIDLVPGRANITKGVGVETWERIQTQQRIRYSARKILDFELPFPPPPEPPKVPPKQPKVVKFRRADKSRFTDK